MLALRLDFVYAVLTERLPWPVTALQGEMSRRELQDALGLKDPDHFREAYLQPALVAKLIEMTVPDRPRSRRQKYRKARQTDKSAGRPWETTGDDPQ